MVIFSLKNETHNIALISQGGEPLQQMNCDRIRKKRSEKQTGDLSHKNAFGIYLPSTA